MAKKIKQSTRQTRRDDSETKQAKVKERAATSRAVPVSHAGKSEEAKNTRKAAVKHLSTAPAKSHLTSPVQKSATRSSQSLQTQAVHANALMANLQDSESCPPNNLIISVDDASGPRYRKIALNGRPMPDEQPHHKEETDREKEETFVDALTLGLRHSTTDIHIPLVGGELALEARRDVHSEVWSLRSGLRPDERPDLPFGTCWSSNLTPNLHIVYQFETDNPCPQYDPVYAYATDENGSTHRFVRLDSTTGRHYFPMPNARTEQETFLMTLQVDSQGRFVLTKKHGTTLIYEALPHIEIPLAMDRFQGSGTELHTYYRLISIQDRFGTTIEYHYPTNLTEEQRTLNPGEIVFKDVPQGSGQTIFGTGTGGGGSS